MLDEIIDFGFSTLETGDQILPLIFESVDYDKEIKKQGTGFFDKNHIKAE